MKYSTVQISPDSANSGVWRVTFADLPHEREAGEGCPNSLGFFHYPRKLGKKAAFDKLKTTMISRHKEEIGRLTRSMKSLQKVQFPTPPNK
jgi:hypothetical protein